MNPSEEAAPSLGGSCKVIELRFHFATSDCCARWADRNQTGSAGAPHARLCVVVAGVCPRHQRSKQARSRASGQCCTLSDFAMQRKCAKCANAPAVSRFPCFTHGPLRGFCDRLTGSVWVVWGRLHDARRQGLSGTQHFHVAIVKLRAQEMSGTDDSRRRHTL